ncbi:nicolin-1 isoform X2 [Gallus gallus]|uniref:nicolin-1 isoform X2 n=1 Tax=Gallus gallus TaxID=9031 RepID=UPI001F00F22C|nr:nicolin-1 isoform X2 [Gallus gallus]
MGNADSSLLGSASWGGVPPALPRSVPAPHRTAPHRRAPSAAAAPPAPRRRVAAPPALWRPLPAAPPRVPRPAQRGAAMSGAPGPGRAPLPCTARPAAPLQLPGGAEAARPGVAVIDVRFPRGSAADVHEIVFKNFYTAFLSVRAQRAGPPGPRKWVTCLRDLRLMPCPHTEPGAQDYFSLRRSQMLCDMEQVTALRFILRQPSPAWLHFGIEELQLFPPGSKTPPQDVPSWLSQLSPPEQPPSLHGELPDPEKVAAEVQQMWALTEVVRARQAAARIGRFDVDGCYDVNLLSYS